MAEANALGFLFLGMTIGLYLPKFPGQLDFLNTYLGIITFIIAVFFFLRR